MTEGSRFSKYASDWMKFEEPEDKIEGSLVRTYEELGQTGDTFPVLVLANDEGERRVRASQFDLKQQLAQKDPQDGDWLEIELIGFEQVAKGKMKRFRLDVTRNGDAF
jgi:hypothetical protein